MLKSDITKTGYVMAVQSALLPIIIEEKVKLIGDELKKLPNDKNFSSDENAAKESLVATAKTIRGHLAAQIKDINELLNNLKKS